MGSLTLLMWGIRIFLFTLYESPKYLMGKGEDDEAVAARVNGKEGSVKLTADDLTRVAYGSESGLGEESLERNGSVSGGGVSRKVVLKQLRSAVDANHVKSLFATRRLAWSTGLLIVLCD